MSIEQLLNKNIDRRQFLKETGKVTAGLAGLLSGCAPALKEIREEDVGKINWDCNPILPIPPVGCYVAMNEEHDFRGPASAIVRSFERDYGLRPAFVVAAGKYNIYNESFPNNYCNAIRELGAIPLLYYSVFPFKDFRPILKGTHDRDIMEFADKVAKYGHPIVLLPFIQPNEPGREHTRWAKSSPNEYKEAWVRMHDLFSKQGANKNTIWSTKLKMGRWRTFSYPNPFPYIPPDKYVDIIGWQANDHCKPEIGLDSQPLDSLFDSYYNEAARKFVRKPQAFWELSTARGPKQARWLDNALHKIKNKYLRVKVVMLDVIAYYSSTIYGNFDPYPTPESKQVIKKHFADPYFIGAK